MTFSWNDKSIAFMEDANSISTYYSDLVSLLLPYLENTRTICDAGCGLGHLAKELGLKGFETTACDISSNAISHIRKKNYLNVTPLECDLVNTDLPLSFDAMVFHYFGSIDEILNIGRKMCTGKLFIIKRAYKNHRFSFSENRIESHTAQDTEQKLTTLGIKYEKKDFTHEMGQPFRSLEDAKAFFEIYSKDKDRSLINEENILSRLKTTESTAFPYYLENMKESTLFVLD